MFYFIRENELYLGLVFKNSLTNKCSPCEGDCEDCGSHQFVPLPSWYTLKYEGEQLIL